MGLRLRFGFGPLRVSVPLTGRRRRRKRRTTKRKVSTFHAEARLPDGSVFKCHHEHRTQQAAIECAAKYRRSIDAEARVSTHRPVGTSTPREAPQVGKPQKWWPRAGWGTIRNYRVESAGGGRVNLSFTFVPDDGGQPQSFNITDTAPMREMGEYARGVVRGENITIKVSAQGMAEAERIFQRINQLELSKRRTMFADRSDIDGDAGWTWTPTYTLAKAAPGLFG